ncbi:MAG: dicarboxylate/amino acid:cation symporter [Oligoflexia bacterium]|nr:dicarboxylate/amino acid:cation symporter [Oligoflexia bacterium]
MKAHHKLLISLVLGAVLGIIFHQYVQNPFVTTFTKNVLDPLGQVFLRLIFMIVVPMVFTGLVLGVYQLSEHHGLGKVVSKTIIFTVLTSAASVIIGITLVNFFKPGVGLNIQDQLVATQSANTEKIKTNAAQAKSAVQSLVEIIPKNPIDSAARALDGEMIALMFFALVFGIALSRNLDGSGGIIKIFEQVYEACMRIVAFAMKLAPYAVFALVFSSAFKFGHQLLVSLALYVGIVVLGLLIQQFGVYSFLLKSFTKKSPIEFFKNCREVYMYAFATASSNATLPKSLEAAEHKLKLPKETSRFVLTVGSTANQNGTALFEGITVLFLAQIYSIDLTLAQQVQVVLMSILAGIGTAGVPGGSLPLIVILLQQVGIPAEGIGVVLGVDRFLDMCRTTVNVSGDLVITALVSGNKKS